MAPVFQTHLSIDRITVSPPRRIHLMAALETTSPVPLITSEMTDLQVAKIAASLQLWVSKDQGARTAHLIKTTFSPYIGPATETARLAVVAVAVDLGLCLSLLLDFLNRCTVVLVGIAGL